MSTEFAYGCLFCVTGREKNVANRIMNVYSDITAVVAEKEKLRFINGHEIKERSILLPCYVFIKAPKDFNLFGVLSLENVIRVLSADRDWNLHGNDCRLVDWFFKRDGLLETSKVFRENDRIRIISGPLKDLEGSVCRINRHNRRGQIKLSFDGRDFMVWLNFDIVEPYDLEGDIQSIDT